MTPGWTLSKRGSGGTVDALLAAPVGSAWLCEEGDRIVIDAVTAGLPTLGMAGQAVTLKSLTHGADGYQARFEIVVDTWAGFTRLEAGDGMDARSLALEVRPHRYKLGASAFDDMLSELSERSAGLIWGLSPGAASGAQASGALAVVHPAVLQSQLPRFLRLVGAYLANPPTSTVRVTRLRALDLARRPDIATLRCLGRRPALLKALQGEAGAGRFADPRQPIDQPEVIASTDHPMTRYLAYLLHQLVRRVRTSEEALRTAKARPFPDPAVEAHAARLADSMAGGARQLESLTRVPLLRLLRPLADVVEHIDSRVAGLDKEIAARAKASTACKRLMTVPGVGPLVALTYAAGVDDPARFSDSRTVGAHFGLTPRRFQSGEMDWSGGISRAGDAGVRRALYQAANVLIHHSRGWCALKVSVATATSGSWSGACDLLPGWIGTIGEIACVELG